MGWSVEPDWNNLIERWNDPIVIVLVIVAVVWMVYDIRYKLRRPPTVSLEHRWVLRRGRRKIEIADEEEALALFTEAINKRGTSS
jgi:hypothetical protein